MGGRGLSPEMATGGSGEQVLGAGRVARGGDWCPLPVRDKGIGTCSPAAFLGACCLDNPRDPNCKGRVRMRHVPGPGPVSAAARYPTLPDLSRRASEHDGVVHEIVGPVLPHPILKARDRLVILVLVSRVVRDVHVQHHLPAQVACARHNRAYNGSARIGCRKNWAAGNRRRWDAMADGGWQRQLTCHRRGLTSSWSADDTLVLKRWR